MQLIQGSYAIDRMKKEARELISMVIGFAKLTNKHNGVTSRTIHHSETCEWRIAIDFKSLDHSLWKIEVECYTKHSYGLASAYTNTNLFLNKSVQIVYEDLDTFVNAINTLLPDIENYWEYVIKASNTELVS